ncbi:MAG: DUF5309 family protein [Candidatus Peribacteraceae bacterium]|nr:DUF5309 family protein [Candidatus Peribacteraceae bacterium]
MPGQNNDGFSYSYQNEVRDVDEDWSEIVAEAPYFSSLVQDGSMAEATKHEWNEGQFTAVKQTATNSVDGSNTTEFSDVSGLSVGDVMRRTASTGATIEEMVTILSISAPTVTFTRGYGGVSQDVISDGQIFIRAFRPRLQKTESETGTAWEPGVNFNYTQIFDTEAEVAKTARAVRQYGIDDALNLAVRDSLVTLNRDWNNALLYGLPIAPSTGVAAAMGGLRYMVNTFGIVDTSGGAVSRDLLNDGFEQLFLSGGEGAQLGIVCSTNQARHVSSFNLDATGNSRTVREGNDRLTGNRIEAVFSDIPGRGGFEATMVVDPNMPKDEIYMVDFSKIERNPLRTFEDVDATPKGADFFRRRILGEMTTSFKDANSSTVVFKGLDL